MGLLSQVLNVIFGAGSKELRQTVALFRENSEAGAVRDSDLRQSVLQQYGQEFSRNNRGGFDRFADGLNRLPRPGLALGTLGLFIAAMIDPVWFAARMQGVALVPEPLWWLLGVIVSFYFGARHQAKGHEFQSQLSQTMARVPMVVDNLQLLDQIRVGSATPGEDSQIAQDVIVPEENPALQAWRNTFP